MYGGRYGIGAPGVVSPVNGPFGAPYVFAGLDRRFRPSRGMQCVVQRRSLGVWSVTVRASGPARRLGAVPGLPLCFGHHPAS